MKKTIQLVLCVLFSIAAVVCGGLFGLRDSDWDKPVSSTATFWNEFYNESMSEVPAEMEVYDAAGLAAWFWGVPGSGDTIYLTNDIDMSEYYWPTVPTFDGITIEGNGYAITGIKIDYNMIMNMGSEEMRYAINEYGTAMIAYMTNCTINNLVISGYIVDGGGPAVGAMAAQAEGCNISGLVANFSVQGSAYEYGGGIIGKATSCSLERMGFKGYFGVFCGSNESYVGGIFGYADSGIENSYFYARFNSDAKYAGGIVGYTDGAVAMCYAAYYANSAFNRNYIGGIAGKASSVSSCFAAPCGENGAPEYFDTAIFLGGAIAGEADGIDSCYWAGNDCDSPNIGNTDGKLQDYELDLAINDLDLWNNLSFDPSIWGYFQIVDSPYIESQGFPFLLFEETHQLKEYVYYTVTFNGNGGTTSSGESTTSVSVVEGGTATCPKTFTRSGYVFAGWSGSLTNITSNKTVYASWAVAYTITYDGNGGTTSSGSTRLTQTVGANLSFYTYSKGAFAKSGYKIVNWSTTKSTSTTNPTVSGSYTGVSTSYYFTANSNITLYAVWKVDRDFEVTVRIYTDINATGKFINSSSSTPKMVDSFTITYYYDADGTATAQTKTSSPSESWSWYSTTIKGMIQKQFTFTYVMKSGYQFIGYKRSSTSTYGDIDSSNALYPTTIMNDSSFSFTPSGLTDDKYLYVFVRKFTSNNKLKFDSSENYYYFEDGYFPQSYVGDSLNSTLNSASSGSLSLYQNLQYLDGSGVIQTIPIYTYSGNKYAKVTKNGTTKWFKMEAIRWRVSDYGASSTTYPTAWGSVTSRSNFKVVSDRVLWFGAVTTTETKESWAFDSSEMATTFANIYVKNGEALTSEKPVYAATYGEKSYYFGEVGQQVKVKYTTKSVSGINIATKEEIEESLTDLKAKASDMVAFVMGIDDDSCCNYWTRELGSSLRNGKLITSSGTYDSEWLQNFNGVRFSLRMSEGSKV